MTNRPKTVVERLQCVIRAVDAGRNGHGAVCTVSVGLIRETLAALQQGEAQEGWVEREGRLAQYGDEFATPPAPQVTVADCIAALKAMPTCTEALGDQDFKYIQLGEALDTLRALAGDGRRRQMKALIVGGPDRGQVVDVQDDDPRVDRVLMGSHVHNFIVDADVPNPQEYVMRELCRAYEYLMKGETHRQHIKKNGKL